MPGGAALVGFKRTAHPEAVAKVSPVAYAYQGYPLNRVMFNATVTRVTQAIVGELSFDEAMAKLEADIAEAVAQAKK